MNIYIVSTYSDDPGDVLKAFSSLAKAEQFRDSISTPMKNGDDVVYVLASDSFCRVAIDTTELVA